MAKQMQEVEGSGYHAQKAVVEEPKKEEKPVAQEAPAKIALAQPKGEADAFGDALANYLTEGQNDPKMGQALEQAIAGNSTVSEKAPKDPNEKSLAEILKSCKDEIEMVEKVLSRKDGLNHLLLTDTNHLMQKIADEYPQYAKISSIGKSFEGRDINMLEITAPDSVNGQATQSLSMAPIEGDQPEGAKASGSKKPAIFMTGATHARELISTSINLFKAVQLIQQGVINKDKTYAKFLQDNKYYFVPILNVDGVALIE